jgi:hypothetical protein
MSYSKLKGLALVSKVLRQHISKRRRSKVEAIYLLLAHGWLRCQTGRADTFFPFTLRKNVTSNGVKEVQKACILTSNAGTVLL